MVPREVRPRCGLLECVRIILTLTTKGAAGRPTLRPMALPLNLPIGSTASVAFEELDGSLVPLGGCTGLERAEVPSSSRPCIARSRIDPVHS